MSTTTLITGAASGIGRATAELLATKKHRLVLTTRGNADGLEATAEVVRKLGSQATTFIGDLTEDGTVEALVAHARDSFGRVDQIVSNAGHAHKTTMADLAQSELDAAFSLNTRPFLALVQAARSDLETSECGRVVAVSSFVTQKFGVNGTLFPATSASKAATVALAKSLAFELAGFGSTVNCVAPGYTEKEGNRGALNQDAWKRAALATPNGRLAKPSDIAAAIAFFLSKEAGHITGQVLNVDGGLSLH